MPLSALITAADMTAYGYAAVPDAVLLQASTRVRRYTQQLISAGSSTVALSGSDPWLLPQRPVISVTTVVDENGNATTNWRVLNEMFYADWCRNLKKTISVTYQHGYSTLPDVLVEIICAIAQRLGSMPSGITTGARTEQAGGEAVTWGTEAYSGVSGLTSAEESALNSIFIKRPRTHELRAGAPGGMRISWGPQ